jgi:hypothetical protein
VITALRCQHCEGAIGVYEPMMVLTEGEACRTSRDAVRDAGPADECYHLACYTLVARAAGWTDGPLRVLRSGWVL